MSFFFNCGFFFSFFGVALFAFNMYVSIVIIIIFNILCNVGVLCIKKKLIINNYSGVNVRYGIYSDNGVNRSVRCNSVAFNVFNYFVVVVSVMRFFCCVYCVNFFYFLFVLIVYVSVMMLNILFSVMILIGCFIWFDVSFFKLFCDVFVSDVVNV